MIEKYLTKDVFTPSIPAKLTFIERDEINDQLVDSIITPGKQVIVFGHTGCGKSTLLINKLTQLYENYIITRCTENSEIEQLILDAFDKLDRFYIEAQSNSSSNKISGGLSGHYFGIKASINASHTSESNKNYKRIIPPQLTAQRLAEFLGDVNCCWVIEDFHKVKIIHKKELAKIMKVFVDTACFYPDVKIIALGAVDSASKIVEYENEMTNRVAEIEVRLMTKFNIFKIIEKGEELLNLSFDFETKKLVAELSNGLAAVCHQLCLNMCLINNIMQTCTNTYLLSTNDLDKAIDKYIKEQSATFKRIYDVAIKQERKGKYNNGEIFLRAFCSFDEDEVSSNKLLSRIRLHESNYPASNLNYYLKLFMSPAKNEIIRYNENSNKYFFSNPFFKVYCSMILESKTKEIENYIEFLLGSSNIKIDNANIKDKILIGGRIEITDKGEKQ